SDYAHSQAHDSGQAGMTERDKAGMIAIGIFRFIFQMRLPWPRNVYTKLPDMLMYSRSVADQYRAEFVKDRIVGDYIICALNFGKEFS
ncbi:hypothetical protein, partial [Candidatus Magnetominusculus dajiuhuensis]|uniref:hypothetical protein n=1 Tax=Candidatus Magnetominusculus dajiuhuensis TaxID=3137712 RepID=UPI003B436555